MKVMFAVPKKPSTLIAATIKQGYYLDPDKPVGSIDYGSQFMCHAIQALEIDDKLLVNKTIELIEDKLYKICPEAMVHYTITLHEVLNLTEGNSDPDYEPSFKRKLKFWKEFMKELKGLGQ